MYIYTYDPYDEASNVGINTDMVNDYGDEEDEPILYVSYQETSDAIVNDEEEIHTTQMAFLSHIVIDKLGYDIVLVTEDCEVLFDRSFTKHIPPNLYNNFYYMLDLYKIGELFEEYNY